MTITVRSNEKPITPPAAAAETQTAETNAGDSKGSSKETATLSAPDGKSTEQNESEESETLEKEDASHEGETKEGDEEKEPQKKKGGFQRRIDKLNQRVTAKEQEAEFWKQQALKNASAPKAESEVNSATKTAPSAEGKPKPENFETHTEYVEALADWKLEAKLKERDAKAVKEKIDFEQNKIVTSYTEKVKAFSEKTSDFADVISEVDHIPLSPALRDIILTSDNGPQLAYELAKNPAEYERIAKLPPLACAREMGKLEYRLYSKSASPQSIDKKITKAPKPIETVGTGGKGSTGKSIFDSNLSQSQYEALRREQMKKRRQA